MALRGQCEPGPNNLDGEQSVSQWTGIIQHHQRLDSTDLVVSLQLLQMLCHLGVTPHKKLNILIHRWEIKQCKQFEFVFLRAFFVFLFCQRTRWRTHSFAPSHSDIQLLLLIMLYYLWNGFIYWTTYWAVLSSGSAAQNIGQLCLILSSYSSYIFIFDNRTWPI